MDTDTGCLADGLGKIGRDRGGIGLGGRDNANGSDDRQKTQRCPCRKTPTEGSQESPPVDIDGPGDGERDGGGDRRTPVADWLENGQKCTEIAAGKGKSPGTIPAATVGGAGLKSLTSERGSLLV